MITSVFLGIQGCTLCFSESPELLCFNSDLDSLEPHLPHCMSLIVLVCYVLGKSHRNLQLFKNAGWVSPKQQLIY